MFRRIAGFFKGLVSKDNDSRENELIDRLDNDPDDDQAFDELLTSIKRRSKKSIRKKSHKKWKNQLKNQVIEPLQYFKPNSLKKVDDILSQALRSGLKVKAAGSGHSYSDVATTSDFFIDTHSLDQMAGNKTIAGQLKQEDIKTLWQQDAMKSKWKSMDGTPEIDVDSPLEDILKVRSIAENNTLLFEMEAGIKIRNLNKALTSKGLGLSNMGGYDEQTIIGAISTSTHGSGITLGPFPDMVKSIILVTTGKWNGEVISGQSNDRVNYYRIERSNGITDPENYKGNQSDYTYNGKDIQLIQDDDCFYSAIVSLGTMGVIYSLVIEVIQLYYLTETRECSNLKKALDQLKPNPANPKHIPDVLHRYRNYEFLIHPYPMDNNKVMTMDLSKPPTTYYEDFLVLETKRNVTHPPEKDDDDDKGDKNRNLITKILGNLGISFKILAGLVNTIPGISPKLVKSAMEGLEDQNYVKKSFKIYNLGLDGDAGFANEIAFPLYDDNGNFTTEYLEKAINKIHEIAQKARIEGRQYQTSPFSIRFVNQSPVYFSMMNRGMTTMIELDMITGTYSGEEICNRLQEGLYEMEGIPHWGLEFDILNGNNGLLQKMYPNYSKWLSVYKQFNSEGTFESKTTNRLGFSANPFK